MLVSQHINYHDNIKHWRINLNIDIELCNTLITQAASCSPCVIIWEADSLRLKFISMHRWHCDRSLYVLTTCQLFIWSAPPRRASFFFFYRSILRLYAGGHAVLQLIQCIYLSLVTARGTGSLWAAFIWSYRLPDAVQHLTLFFFQHARM